MRPAGLRFITQQKNEPEHPEQLKSGMQKYNGTSLSKHRLVHGEHRSCQFCEQANEVTTTCF